MESYLADDSADMISLDEFQLFMLMFADDTVLFSYSSRGLQILLNKLKIYCLKWNITVNTTKTVAMVFKLGNRLEHVDLYYDNVRLNVVSKFCYLGVVLSANGKFYGAKIVIRASTTCSIYVELLI